MKIVSVALYVVYMHHILHNYELTEFLTPLTAPIVLQSTTLGRLVLLWLNVELSNVVTLK